VHALLLSVRALRQAFNNELRALMDMDVDSDSPFPALPAAGHAHPANTCCTEMAHAADTGKNVRFVARCTKYMAVMMVTTLLPALESVQASLNSMEQSQQQRPAAAALAIAGCQVRAWAPRRGSCAPLYNLCLSELHNACSHTAMVRRKALRRRSS